MNTVIVLFKEQGSCQFLFDHYDHALKAHKVLAVAKKVACIGLDQGQLGCDEYDLATPEIRDDYGTVAVIDGGDIRAVLVQDFHRHLEGVVLYNLEQQRAQAALGKKMASDPTLRLLTPSGPLPGVMHG